MGRGPHDSGSGRCRGIADPGQQGVAQLRRLYRQHQGGIDAQACAHLVEHGLVGGFVEHLGAGVGRALRCGKTAPRKILEAAFVTD